MKLPLKRCLFLAHRWLGLCGCLLITLWFVSGFVMMYVPFPNLGDEERLAALPAVDSTAQLLQPAQVVALAGNDTLLQMRLLQPTGSPIYALRLENRGWLGVRATDGEPLQINATDAARAAERFAGQPSVSTELVERDQWSVSSNLDSHRPLFAVHMADGGLHYVSSRTGEVVRDTQRLERGLNWVGAVVHWVYPTVLRSQPLVWHWTVIGLSGYALLTAVLGTVVGMRRWRRYASGKYSPYMGWMRWHHILGLGSAVFVLAWLFSGLMSMNPGDVFSPRKPSLEQLKAWGGEQWQPQLPPLAGVVKEVEWLADPAGTQAWVRETASNSRLVGVNGQVDIDENYLLARAGALGLGSPVGIARLDAFDLHYHARNAARPLPVWRLTFADAQQTWAHVDHQNGQVFGRIDASNRAGRWLYHGLHSWDFEPLLKNRPLWDALMLAALALGSAFSITSVCIAWQRLRTYWRQFAFAPPQTNSVSPSISSSS